MLCLVNGIEMDVPNKLIRIIESKGMIGLGDNAINELDIARADEAAQDICLGQYVVPLSWNRIYFELDDGKRPWWPVGLQSRNLYAVWELTMVDLQGLRKANPQLLHADHKHVLLQLVLFFKLSRRKTGWTSLINLIGAVFDENYQPELKV